MWCFSKGSRKGLSYIRLKQIPSRVLKVNQKGAGAPLVHIKVLSVICFALFPAQPPPPLCVSGILLSLLLTLLQVSIICTASSSMSWPYHYLHGAGFSSTLGLFFGTLLHVHLMKKSNSINAVVKVNVQRVRAGSCFRLTQDKHKEKQLSVCVSWDGRTDGLGSQSAHNSLKWSGSASASCRGHGPHALSNHVPLPSAFFKLPGIRLYFLSWNTVVWLSLHPRDSHKFCKCSSFFLVVVLV